MDLPYLTPDFPGIPATIKARPEDFFVQEIPLYEPSGQGEHVYAEIQKVGLTTFEAINRISRALNVSPKGIGYAGMKDAQAVTRQVLSIQGTTPERVMGLKLDNITISWAIPHGNKLRLGHLKANRFAIRLRDVNPTDVVKLQPVLKTIEDRGLPNYFGEQRFGRRGDNRLLGAAIVRADPKGLLDQLLGKPMPSVEDAQTTGARKAYDRNDLKLAMKLWPRKSGMERRVLARVIKTGKPIAAVKAIDERLRRLWVSAVQSHMFNEVLAQRVRSGNFDRLLPGDLAYKHENGACFLVEDAAIEQPRAAAWEISPTGPLVGYRMTLPAGEPLQIEEAVLAEAHLKPEDFRKEGGEKVKGARRPLRVRPEDVQLSGGVDEHGGHITVAFTLPAGSFATVLIRELTKDREPAVTTHESEEASAS
ncbi:MAG TPA: tRNA pseudouridine(13) synthase TruD [Tepidisphaeraceae bacterium]|jgi:tRNA pseudouridine13 synthase